MPQNPSINAYPEARRFMDAALDAPNGAATSEMSEPDAKKFRQNCYHLRANVRRHNQRVYDPDHPMYSASPWDSITIKLEPGERGYRCIAHAGTSDDFKIFDPKTGEELTP